MPSHCFIKFSADCRVGNFLADFCEISVFLFGSVPFHGGYAVERVASAEGAVSSKRTDTFLPVRRHR